MKESKVREGEISQSVKSMLEAYDGLDDYAMASPGSPGQDEVSPGSTERAPRVARPEAEGAENNTELTIEGDPAGLANQHQILQNRRLKESTEQYQIDQMPKAEDDQRPARTAENV
jgi:hypothetical protein